MRRSLSPTDLAQKAFVRGLPDDTDEDAIRRLFSKYGTVTEGTQQPLFAMCQSCLMEKLAIFLHRIAVHHIFILLQCFAFSLG
jgi:RNA recognition motif-containing protein